MKGIRQFAAADGSLWQLTQRQRWKRDATSVHQLMKANYDERRATRWLPGCRERKVADMVPKSVLSMPTSVGLNASDEDKWFHFLCDSSQVGVLSQREKGYSAAGIVEQQPTLPGGRLGGNRRNRLEFLSKLMIARLIQYFLSIRDK